MGAWICSITAGTSTLVPKMAQKSSYLPMIFLVPFILEAAWPETYCVAQASLKLTAILLPQILSLKHVSKGVRVSWA